jgi:hypothetical protein
MTTTQEARPTSDTGTQSPQAVVVDTSNSPHAQLHPVPLAAVTLRDTFWEPRREINRRVTLLEQYEHCETTGRLDNFRRASGKKDVPFQGIFFNDSDVYKWLEGVAWTLATVDDPQLAQLADTVIEEIADAQQPDGYLDTYFMFDKAAERWTNFDLHELYCAGHLFQAAVAHYRATGSTRLLDVATRFADLICDLFGPEEQGKRPWTDGHEEVEMALVELYRVTGNRRYLDQAQYFVDVRGYGLFQDPQARFGTQYYQNHVPLRDMEQITGHAVRAVYYNAGAADLHAETGDAALMTALDRLWHNMTGKRMYVSGGLGSRYEGEAFGEDYELPNARAYTETCAAIGSVMWNWRMLALTGDARYSDLIEWTLYNAMLPGLSLDGQTYFYQNPLADDGHHRRQAWFGCACCPPNVARMLPSLPGYFYSTSNDGVWVHLYAENDAQLTLPDGRMVKLQQRTNYPWDGTITIEVQSAGEYALMLRVPAWCQDATLTINGEPSDQSLTPGSYVALHRSWQVGDQVELRLPMPVRYMESHPHVTENAGRVALTRGPLLYCVEGVDHRDADVRDLVLPSDVALDATFEPNLLGGVTVLHGRAGAQAVDAQWNDMLYRMAGATPRAEHDATLTAIPYYAWANRQPGHMQVWLQATM